MDIVMFRRLGKSLLSEGYTQQQINAYFKQAGEVSLTKTHGRSLVATLNKMIEYLGFLPMGMNLGELYYSESTLP